jgi:oxygen-independent coproporphyrinogen-3 oxidase
MSLIQVARPATSTLATLRANPLSPANSQQYSKELVFYTHVPFCTSKCHFCFWVVRVAPKDLVHNQNQFETYTQGLLAEIEGHAKNGLYSNRPLRSIYFGGGTPSILSGDQLSRLMKTILANTQRSPEFESATLEVSPQTIDYEKLCQVREAGFDRISMGVQVFSDRVLRSQARGHTVEQAIEAYHLARRAGFENINIDLLIGLPEVTLQEWENSISTVLQLYPNHVSIYTYRPVPSTVSGQQIIKGLSKLQEDRELIDLYLWSARQLTEHGYLQYSQQLFERDGKRCNCDESCFQLKEEWIGHGAGAKSMVNQHFFGHSTELNNYLTRPTRYDYLVAAQNHPNLLQNVLFQMLTMQPGINYGIFEHRFGISVEQAAQRFPAIQRFLTEVKENYDIVSDEQGIRYRNFTAATIAMIQRRTEWLEEGEDF